MQTSGTNAINRSASSLLVGNNSGDVGSYNLSGGLLLSSGEFVGVQGNGYFAQTGGTNTMPATLFLGTYASATGLYHLDDGLLAAASEYVGFSGSGALTQGGGTNSISNSLNLAQNAASSGTYNLNGGLLHLAGLAQGPGTATFNFSGGTLQAGGSFSSSVPMQLSGTDAIDTNGALVTLSGALSDAGSGSLTKLGAGTLVLSGSNSYLGGTIVSEGTLVVTNGNAIADGTSLTVGTGASQFLGSPATAGSAVANIPAFAASAVPEPSTLVLLGAAAILALFYGKRRRGGR